LKKGLADVAPFLGALSWDEAGMVGNAVLAPYQGVSAASVSSKPLYAAAPRGSRRQKRASMSLASSVVDREGPTLITSVSAGRRSSRKSLGGVLPNRCHLELDAQER